MEYSARHRKQIVLVAILLLAFALRVACLTHDRFHADEALYAGWALRILDDDPLLLDEPVDKPPLFLYAMAGTFRLFGTSEVAARWINLACSMVGIALVYRLFVHLFTLPQVGTECADQRCTRTHRAGRLRQLLNLEEGSKEEGGEIWAALFLACSPFDVLFARTAFTDPMLSMWWLAGLLAAVQGHTLLAGLFGGLAMATKQNAVILIPLIPALGLVINRQTRIGAIMRALVAWGIGLALPWGLTTWWDSARWAIRPGYWDQSVLSYGGLTWASVAEWPERLLDWLSWARYLAGGWTTGLAFVAGVIGLMVAQAAKRFRLVNALWAVWMTGYLGMHVVLRFSIWDRYLLPLAAPTALLEAQIVRLGYTLSGSSRIKKWPGLVAVLIALAVGGRAAFNGYPVGGEHWAYQGIDRVTAYLKAHAAPDAVLYHHWLRWHYTYYLHGTDFELRWWRDGAHLRQEAARTDPAREQYIVLPDWRPLDPAIEGIRFEPILQAERLTLYRVIVE